MATRRQAREWALQMLFQFDMNSPTDVEAEITAFWEQQTLVEQEDLENDVRKAKKIFTSGNPRTVLSLVEMKAFAEERVRGVFNSREQIDSELEARLKNWSLYRLGTIERNVLRMGIWELRNVKDIPAPVIVNESVDLAKFFSETRSGRFVNAILDGYAKAMATETFEV